MSKETKEGQRHPVRDDADVRRFRKIGGFEDTTDFIEICKNGNCVLHSKNNEPADNVDNLYTLSDCLFFVANGTWEELTASQQLL